MKNKILFGLLAFTSLCFADVNVLKYVTTQVGTFPTLNSYVTSRRDSTVALQVGSNWYVSGKCSVSVNIDLHDFVKSARIYGSTGSGTDTLVICKQNYNGSNHIFDTSVTIRYVNGAVKSINPQWFGCRGDSSDQTSAFNAAIRSAKLSTMKILQPAKTVIGIKNGILLTSGTFYYEGEDRNTSVIAMLDSNAYVFRLGALTGATIRNISIEGNSYKGTAIEVGYLDGGTYYGPSRPIIDNIKINAMGWDGIRFRKGNLSSFTNLIITSCGTDSVGLGNRWGDGFRVDGYATSPDANACVFSNVDIRSCRGWGFNLEAGSSNYINGLTCQSNGNAGGTSLSPVNNKNYGNIRVNDRKNYLQVYCESAGEVSSVLVNTGARELWLTPKNVSSQKRTTGNVIFMVNGTAEDESYDKANTIFYAPGTTYNAKWLNFVSNPVTVYNGFDIGKMKIAQDSNRLFRMVFSNTSSSHTLSIENATTEYDYRVAVDSTQTLAYGIRNAAGCIRLSRADGLIPMVSDKFYIVNTKDFTGTPLATVKGSALVIGDVFRVTDNDTATAAVEYVGAKGTGVVNGKIDGAFDAGGHLTTNSTTGFIGVGTSSPREQLEIKTASGVSPDFLMSESSDGAWRIRNLQSNNSLNFQFTRDFSNYSNKINIDTNSIIRDSAKIIVYDTTSSTSATTGAVTIAGGLGVAKKLYVGGGIVSSGSLTGLSQMSADTITAIKVLNLRKHSGSHFVGSGDVYYDSLHDAVECFTNGVPGTVNRCLFAQSNIVTDSASAAEVSLKGIDSIIAPEYASWDSLPANWFKRGKRLRFGIGGIYSTKATSAGTAILRLKLNNTIVDSAIITLDNNEVDQTWRMDGAVVCQAVGSSGRVVSVSNWLHSRGTGAYDSDPIYTLGTTINTTIAQKFDLTWQFSDATVATRANKIKSIIFYLEEIH
jgi:hypothetical protein